VGTLTRAVAGLVAGLAGLVLVAATGVPALDGAGAVIALAGWLVYWRATFVLILARARRGR